MKRFTDPISAMRLAAAAVFALVLAACASIGRPEGGARDEVPPTFVRSTPAPGALNVNRTRLDAWFDENIQLDDPFNKVIVSPTQTQAPVVRSLGRHLYVELRDTLIPNTTYTIDFADAVKDLNEGNILDGFALDFSTGSEIDTLRISGVVLEARTLEPAQGMTVGIFREPSDTSLTRSKFERVARTNQYGQFTVRNLKPGRYGVYALNDLNRDNSWDVSEDVAFYGTLVSPSVEAITVSDTLRNAADEDSIVTRPGVAYFPNDILLTWFNENRRPQYLKNYTRPERRKVVIEMGAPSDTLPSLSVVGGPLNGQRLTDHSLLQANTTRDTLTYWLESPEILAIDSLLMSVRHLGTDTLNQTVWQTDTLKFFWHEPKKKEKKKAKNDTLPEPPVLLNLQVLNSTQHHIYEPLRLMSPTPFGSVDTLGFHLEHLVDSLWSDVPFAAPVPDSLSPLLGLAVDFQCVPGMQYRLTVDSAAVADIYGIHNKEIVHEFTVKQPEEYANLVFNISGCDTLPLMVELLNNSDNPVRTVLADHGKARFRYLDPGTYYARLYIDANANGKWDTGSVGDSIQPEEVYYYNKKLDLRANWDVEQAWNIYELALDAQKPFANKKNKPKLKKGEKAPTDDEDVEYDEWGDPIDPAQRNNRLTTGGNRTNGNRGNGGNRGGFGGFGGLQQQSGTTGNLRR